MLPLPQPRPQYAVGRVQPAHGFSFFPSSVAVVCFYLTSWPLASLARPVVGAVPIIYLISLVPKFLWALSDLVALDHARPVIFDRWLGVSFRLRFLLSASVSCSARGPPAPCALSRRWRALYARPRLSGGGADRSRADLQDRSGAGSSRRVRGSRPYG